MTYRYFELNPDHNYHFYKFVRSGEPASVQKPKGPGKKKTGKTRAAKTAQSILANQI